MADTPDNGGNGREVLGSYRPEGEGEEITLLPPSHSTGFDRALERAMREAQLQPGTYQATIRHEAEITVTNPPGVTEYRVILTISH